MRHILENVTADNVFACQPQATLAMLLTVDLKECLLVPLSLGLQTGELASSSLAPPRALSAKPLLVLLLPEPAPAAAAAAAYEEEQETSVMDMGINEHRDRIRPVALPALDVVYAIASMCSTPGAPHCWCVSMFNYSDDRVLRDREIRGVAGRNQNKGATPPPSAVAATASCTTLLFPGQVQRAKQVGSSTTR